MSPDPFTEPLYTTQEFAKRFRVDPKTVTRWIAQGRIPATSVIRTPGGHIRIKASEVEKWWASSQG